MPEFERDDGELSEDEDGEDEDCKDEAGQSGVSKEASVGPEKMDEETSRRVMADKLEALRISRSLGNDNLSSNTATSEEDSDSEADSESDVSLTGPPATDFTTYTRDRNTGRPPRISAKKMDENNGVKDVVVKERERVERGGGTKKGVGAGKAKGHKWKSNDKYLVGKNSGW